MCNKDGKICTLLTLNPTNFFRTGVGPSSLDSNLKSRQTPVSDVEDMTWYEYIPLVRSSVDHPHRSHFSLPYGARSGVNT